MNRSCLVAAIFYAVFGLGKLGHSFFGVSADGGLV